MIYRPNRTPRPASWGIVATCREPSALTLAFVAHHIALGATRIYLYLDDPQPELWQSLKQIPQVEPVLCDRKHWRSHIGRGRPKRQELRQVLNAFDAYTKAEGKVDWLAHIDADEFLQADVPLSDILAAQPEEIGFVRVEVRERAFLGGAVQEGIFDGLFRRPLSDTFEEPSLFDVDIEGTFTRRGLLGYSHSKSIMRTGDGLIPGIHSPRRPSEERNRPLRDWPLLRARLLHFDGLTALHWSAKLLRAAAAGVQNYKNHFGRDQEPQRAAQIREMAKLEGDPEAIYAFHQRLKTIPVDQVGRLEAFGVIESHPFDPAGEIAALNLPHPVDLSRRAFDQALVALHPGLESWQSQWEDMLMQAGTSESSEEQPGQTAASAP